MGDGRWAMNEVPIDAEFDLHSFRPKDIPSVVDEYLTAAHAKGLRRVRIVHGRGTGVQRGIVQNVLEHHALVAAFDDDHTSHLGATFVELRLERQAPRQGAPYKNSEF
jgi:DNA-nicking Smr family endonuclease